MTAAPGSYPLEIFIPYWGDPQLLTRTVDSVRAQDDDRWTLTIVDDCYPDPSVAESFADERDPRVHYQRNVHNLGIAANFQRCLDLASGEAVAFLGCDDILEPGYVARALALLEEFPQADIVQSGVRVIDETGTTQRPLGDRVKAWLRPQAAGPVVLGGEELAASLLRGNWLYWPSLVFRTECVKRHAFRTDLPIILDLALVLDLVADGAQLVLDPVITFAYRRHATSLSGTSLGDGVRFEQDRRYFAEAAVLMDERGWPEAARAARARWTSRLHALTLLPGAARARDARSARQALRHAISR